MSSYVKFTYERVRADIAPFDQLAELNKCRCDLRELGLLGIDSNGIGFGNLSVRDGSTNNFYVTGSATGGFPELAFADCVRVVAYDFENDRVRYEGSAIPSAESLTHAAVYESDPTACAVIHCHDFGLWTMLLDRAPATSKTAAYGTPQMAYEIIRLFSLGDVQIRKMFVMAGHEGGIVSLGKNFEQAFAVLMRERRQSSLR